MDRNVEIKNWLKTMGYDGEIPKTLGNVCNNSTSFIWDQLLQNAKPREEVANIRNNLIIRRLNKKPIDKQKDFSYPLKEIDLYVKKSSLESESKLKQFLVDERRILDHDISYRIKLKCITIEKLKAKMKENEERDYLLQKKMKSLRKDIQQAEDTLNFLGNLTPVELDEKPNTIKITQTLEECAQRLEELLQKYPPLVQESGIGNTRSLCYSAQKSTTKRTVLEKYLTSTEKNISRHLMSTDKFSGHNKENINLKKVTKCLFSEEKEPKTYKVQHNRRESLGILPDSCFYENTIVEELSTEENPFSPTLQVMQRIRLDSPLSMHHTRNGFNNEPDGRSAWKNRKEFLDKMCKSEFVGEQLKDVLHSNNRNIIWNTLQSMVDNLKLDAQKTLVSQLTNKSSHKKMDRSDIGRLQFLHVQTELQILKHNAIAKHLAQQLDKKKCDVYATISSKGYSSDKAEEIKRSFEQQFEDASLEATLSAMKREISCAKNAKERTDLQVVSRKLTQVKESIAVKTSSIREYIEIIHDILTSINRTRDTTIACVRKLVPFIGDMSWSSTLTEGICSGEIRTFEKFPLEYNRRCIHIDSSAPIYFRDICIDNLPSDLEIDDGNLYMLTEILESPFSFPETVVLNILRAKLKLDVLKTTRNPPKDADSKKYSLEDLRHQESYINFALDRLNSLIHSSSSKKSLSSSEIARNIMDIWLKMPFKDFIPPNRKYEENNYAFYENLYDSFYNNL